jgi:rod shape determining protein RodA
MNADGILVTNEYRKQIIFASAGIVLLLVMTFLDYRKFREWSPWLFTGAVLLLVYTRLFGRYVNGAKSWIGIGELGIQPSEFMKIIFILFLARYLEKSRKKDSERRRFIISLCILLLPMALIFAQPDLGTATVYIPIFLAMCFVAGAPVRYLGIVLGCGTCTIIFMVLPLWEGNIARKSIPLVNLLTDERLRLITIAALSSITFISLIGRMIMKKSYYYWIAYISGILTFAVVASFGAGRILKEYQIMRLIVFLDPNIDPLGSGWNIIQSITAIGSGGLTGLGFLQGTQSHYNFLPQQSTDFIFSILSEEWGFAGVLSVFGLFAIIFIRGIVILRYTSDPYGYYIAAGIIFMIFYHFIINVGMVMGIMPITGIPLLFLSYGGSSLWTALIAVGILMSINLRCMDY